MPFKPLMLLMVLFLMACNIYGQTSDLIKEGAQLQKISDQFAFTEGPAVDKWGNVFFTDQPHNRIWEYDTHGRLSVFKEGSGRSNGMYFDRKGNLVTCADENNELWSIRPNGKATVLLKDFKGHRFNGPNDLWIDQKGGIYFTDPYFQRDYWKRKSPDSLLGGEKLYYLPPGKKEAMLADNDLIKPNGVVGTPDGKYLYVAEMGKRVIYRYDIQPDGKLEYRSSFVSELADGMTLDDRGNLYVAGNGVTVYNPEGKKITHIDIPEKWTANLCFGGKDKNLLFITASQSIYILPMKVKGVE